MWRAISKWLDSRHGWKVDPEKELVFANCLVTAGVGHDAATSFHPAHHHGGYLVALKGTPGHF